ncbi:MAG: hypothetical protein M1825_004878 [Sarcosagium campestre]|nr:MAG: hypothetical protein M1825_004878 [Sarcosagium campestre]
MNQSSSDDSYSDHDAGPSSSLLSPADYEKVGSADVLTVTSTGSGKLLSDWLPCLDRHPDLSLDIVESSRPHRPSLPRWLTVAPLRRLCFALLPSYIQSWLSDEESEETDQSPTAALNGLRGFAALFVYFYHYQMAYSRHVEIGYGQSGNWWIIQLPILRVWYAGPAMVAVFFVISGYVLSYRPIHLLHSHSFDRMMHNLSSSVFRRGMRLFLPTSVGTFITMLTVWGGLWEPSRPIYMDPNIMRGDGESHPRILPTFLDQSLQWFDGIRGMTNVWDWHMYFPHYDHHLWTIPVEFKSSMMLFLTITGLARMRVIPRLALLFVLICYCIQWDRWEVVLFLAGMFIAETDILKHRENFPKIKDVESHDEACSSGRRKVLRVCFWSAMFISGLFFTSAPNLSPDQTPGYVWLSKLIPKTYSEGHRFLHSIGAIQLVWSISRATFLQIPFKTRFAQYLGKISYALYIVHGPILHVVGFPVVAGLWELTGTETASQYSDGLCLGMLVVLPTVFWFADIFWRFVDIPSVRLSKWVELQLCMNAD